MSESKTPHGCRMFTYMGFFGQGLGGGGLLPFGECYDFPRDEDSIPVLSLSVVLLRDGLSTSLNFVSAQTANLFDFLSLELADRYCGAFGRGFLRIFEPILVLYYQGYGPNPGSVSASFAESSSGKTAGPSP